MLKRIVNTHKRQVEANIYIDIGISVKLTVINDYIYTKEKRVTNLDEELNYLKIILETKYAQGNQL